ncbi:MAG: CU044_2847 family protein [Leptolyngbyaceae cyanobacterium]
MDKALAQFELEDGSTFLIQVPEPESEDALEPVAIDGQMIYQATQKFEAALDVVKPVASAVLSRLKDGLTTPADEVEVKFGLNLSVDSGVIFATVGGGVNFEVTLKWQGNKE